MNIIKILVILTVILPAKSYSITLSEDDKDKMDELRAETPEINIVIYNSRPAFFANIKRDAFVSGKGFRLYSVDDCFNEWWSNQRMAATFSREDLYRYFNAGALSKKSD
jgi:hypothetical protein